MWKYLAESVVGTSHARTGLPCQDGCLATCVTEGHEAILILVCADGASTARHASLGARLACEAVSRAIHADLADGQRVEEVQQVTALSWLRMAREELEQQAERSREHLREFASTLLLALVAERAAVFAQVGDGAIVCLEGDSYRPVFWPEVGEYINCTNFITDQDFEGHLCFARVENPPSELALFSDGLQRLALDYSTRTGYGPFLAPLFRQLREAADADTLSGPLRAFLDSPRINERTDDDKTLILAIWVAARDAPTAAL